MIQFNLGWDKLWETVSKGTGGAVAPWRIRRDGRAVTDAKRDEMLMLAQTELDVEDIKSGKKKYTEDHKLITVEVEAHYSCTSDNEIKSGKHEPYINLLALDQEATSRKQAQAIQEHLNLTKTVLMAEEVVLNNDAEVSNADVDNDWFVRWRDNAEKVSNEDLQKLWAKALAGEVTNPGSYSLRTLEFLKNISQAEAEQISKLAPYVIDGVIYKTSVIDEKGLKFSYLLEMEDLGILSGVKGGGLSLSIGSLMNNQYLNNIQYGDKILILNSSSTKEASFQAYKVTKLGVEILRLGVFPLDYSYFESIGQIIKSQNFKVTLADISGRSNGRVHYQNAHEL